MAQSSVSGRRFLRLHGAFDRGGCESGYDQANRIPAFDAPLRRFYETRPYSRASAFVLGAARALRLVLLGPPGAGKGTLAQVLSKDWKLVHVSTGDMLREALKNRTPLGLKAKEYMENGKLVPDDVVIGLVSERLLKKDAAQGFILDGFPRTVEQAKELNKEVKKLNMPLTAVLYFKTSVPVI